MHLSLFYVLSQLSGLIAIAVYGFGYFSKTKSKFLLFTLGGDFFYGLSYIITLNFAPAVIALSSMLQMFVFYQYEKRDKSVPLYVIIICIIVRLGISLIFFDSLLDIVPMVATTMLALIYSIRNVQLVKYLSIIPNAILVVYNCIILLFLNALVDFMDCVQLSAAIIAYKIQKNPKHIAKVALRKKQKLLLKIVRNKKLTLYEREILIDEDKNNLSKDIYMEEIKFYATTDKINMVTYCDKINSLNLIVNSNNFINPACGLVNETKSENTIKQKKKQDYDGCNTQEK